MMPYKCYLTDGILPLKLTDARKIKKNFAKYTLIDGELFRHGFTHPILVCVRGDQCERIMADLHEGICRSHDPQDPALRVEEHSVLLRGTEAFGV